jgi:glycosyltransferase involved in cell wall biosynthesis
VLSERPVRISRVAVFIHSLSGGGAQRRSVTLVNGFAERGVEVDLVVITERGPLRRLVDPRVRLVALTRWSENHPLARLPRRIQLFLGLRRIVRYFRRERPAVFMAAASHVHVPVLIAHRIARAGVPLVLRMSNHLSRSGSGGAKPKRRLFAPRFARWLYPDAAAMIAVSQGVADDIVRITGYPRERIHVIYSPVVTAELEKRARKPLDHPWLLPGAPPVVLGVGRLVKQKDFPTLVRAFARVRAQRPARLILLGRAKDSKKRRRLTDLIDSLGIAADVELAGYVDNPLPYMVRAGVLALSSAWEGLPGVLIEALACGCPVVSTDCPSGPAEILDDGRYGRLVPIGDDAALARAILETLDAPPTGDVLRARAGEFVADRSIERYLAVLDSVAAGGSLGARKQRDPRGGPPQARGIAASR